MAAKQLIVAVFLLGASWAQMIGVADNRPELPTELADQCVRNGGVEAYNNVERAFKQVRTCYYNLADREKLLRDILEAQRLGRSANDVFKQYCSRRSQFVGCISELTESFKLCFKAGELARGNLDVVRNVADQLLEFICQDDGAVMTSFITGGGLECLKQPNTGKALKGCSNGLKPLFQHTSVTYYSREPSMGPDSMPAVTVSPIVENVLYMNYNDSTCATLYEFQKCVVQELKSCGQEVANTAQSLIRTVRVSTPCKYKPNSASGLTVTILSSVMAALCLLLV